MLKVWLRTRKLRTRKAVNRHLVKLRFGELGFQERIDLLCRLCFRLIPSTNTRRLISVHCSISVNILHLILRMPHFWTAAPPSATRLTFQ
ncbi:MAG: hypothetical protein ACKOEZ_01735, partial [Spartobacteria bacterium]